MVENSTAFIDSFPISLPISSYTATAFTVSSMETDAGTPEAARLCAIASKLLAARDLVGSKRFAERALSADPDLLDDRADQILAVADVLLASQNYHVNNHYDWYSLLQLPHPNPNPNDRYSPSPAPADFSILLKRHYRRLSLLLHPDRNKFPGADSAFQLVADAYGVLSDPVKKSLLDAELIRTSSSLPAADGTAFWTMCTFCCHAHQYPHAHRGRSLRCPTCSRGFDAVEMQSPPQIISGTDTYESSWGFFPLGFPTSVNSEWKPFVPMFPWNSDSSIPQQSQPPIEQHAVPLGNVAGPSGMGTKKMARKKVGRPKKVPASKTLGGGVGGSSSVGNQSLEKEEVVVAKGIDMNEKAKGPDEAVEVDGFDMLIDLDTSDDVLGNLQNLPFLRDEDMHIQIP